MRIWGKYQPIELDTGGIELGAKILVIDDDENIVRLLSMYLANAGFEMVSANDGSEGLTLFSTFSPDLVLLDVMMPVINGWEVLGLIRKQSTIPVIMLTSRDMVDDKVKGFSLGADDYVVKPFEPREVIARIQARLLRGQSSSDSTKENVVTPEKERGVASCGNLRVDMNRYEVLLNGEKMPLKPKEIQLLYFLLQNKNIVFSRDQLLEKVWEYDFLVDTRTVDVHMKRLRQVLKSDDDSWSLKTVWGVGYKLEGKS